MARKATTRNIPSGYEGDSAGTRPVATASDYGDFTGGGPQYSVNPQQSDPYEIFKENWRQAQDRGNRIDQGLINYGGYVGDRFRLNNSLADDAFRGLSENPGYSTDEQGNILRQDDLDRLRDVDYNRNFLTDDEMSQMRGDPQSTRGWYDPGYTEDVYHSGADRVRGALDSTGRALNEGYDIARGDYGRAVDRAGQGPSNYFTDARDAVLNTTADRVNAGVNREGLQMSGDYAQKAGMSDAEVQGAAERGARMIGSRYKSAVGDIERRAIEGGNASALAIGAMRNRMENDSAASSADAYNDAFQDARDRQRQAATGVEQTRLSTERDIGNRQIQSGEYLGDLARGMVTDTERFNESARSRQTAADMQAAADQAKLRQQGTMFQGQQQTANEQQLGARELANVQNNQRTAIDLNRGIEETQANRAGAIATNRQNVNVGNQNSQYQRGYQTNQAASQRNQTVADARRQGQQEYRGYLTNQGQFNQNQYNTSMGQRIQNSGVQSGAMNTAAGQYGNYDLGRRGQGFGSNFKGSLGRSLGGFLGNPAQAISGSRQAVR